jgi:hypothetical protein
LVTPFGAATIVEKATDGIVLILRFKGETDPEKSETTADAGRAGVHFT